MIPHTRARVKETLARRGPSRRKLAAGRRDRGADGSRAHDDPRHPRPHDRGHGALARLVTYVTIPDSARPVGRSLHHARGGAQPRDRPRPARGGASGDSAVHQDDEKTLGEGRGSGTFTLLGASTADSDQGKLSFSERDVAYGKTADGLPTRRSAGSSRSPGRRGSCPCARTGSSSSLASSTKTTGSQSVPGRSRAEPAPTRP